MQRLVRPFGALALIALANTAAAQSVTPTPATPATATTATGTATTPPTTGEGPAERVAPPPDPPRPASPVPCDQTGSAELMAAARAHFSAGQTHVEGSAWVDAVRELRAALAFYDSPNSRYLLGTALAGLSRFDEAYNEFDGTIEQAARCAQADQTQGRAPRYQETVAGALRDRDALTSRVSLLGVRVPDDAPASLTLQVNGLPLPRRFWNRLRAYPPGDARVLGEASGYARFVGTMPLDPRRARWIDVAMTRDAPTSSARPVATTRSPLRPLGVVLASVGGAAFVTGIGMFFAGQGEYDALVGECGGACPPTGDYPGRIDRGQALESAGIGLFWGGLAVAAAGVTLAIVGGRTPSAGASGERSAAGARATPTLRPGGAGLEVSF